MSKLSELLAKAPKTDEEWDTHCNAMRALFEDDPDILHRPEIHDWVKKHKHSILAAAKRRTL